MAQFSEKDTSPIDLMSNTTSSVLGMDSNQTEQYVDLDALSLAMIKSLMPTIVYLAVLMIMGLVGNSIVFLVYYRRFKPSATRSYILVMSIFDLTANVFSLSSEIIDIRFSFNFYPPSMCRAMRSVNSFLTLVSAFILVAVARDRYRKICHPLDKVRSSRRINLYIAVCCLSAFLLTLPFAVLNGSHTIETGVGNVTGVTCSTDDAFVDTAFPLVYSALMLVAFVGCVGVMAVSYVRIAIALERHKKNLALSHGSFRGTSALPSGVCREKGNSSVVDDTSSGPRTDLGTSGAKAASSTEFLPMADLSLSTFNPQSNPQTDLAPSSDKDVLLLSVNNFNYKDPSQQDTNDTIDEGFFSAWHGDEATVSGEVHCDDSGTTDIDIRVIDQHSHSREGSTKAENNSPTLQNSNQGTTESQPKEVTKEVTKDKVTKDNKVTNDTLSDEDSKGSAGHHQDKNNKPVSLLQTVLRTKGRQYSMRLGANTTTTNTSASTKRRSITKHGAVKKIPSSTTLMMFILTANFVINYLPHLIIIGTRAVIGDLNKGLTGSLLNAYNIGLRSYYLNCAVNSVVYGFCSARFRHECRNLFSSRRR
ncbi:hypothetical protein V1264_009256 [Littorina saxatilis]